VNSCAFVDFRAIFDLFVQFVTRMGASV